MPYGCSLRESNHAPPKFEFEPFSTELCYSQRRVQHRPQCNLTPLQNLPPSSLISHNYPTLQTHSTCSTCSAYASPTLPTLTVLDPLPNLFCSSYVHIQPIHARPNMCASSLHPRKNVKVNPFIRSYEMIPVLQFRFIFAYLVISLKLVAS